MLSIICDRGRPRGMSQLSLLSVELAISTVIGALLWFITRDAYYNYKKPVWGKLIKMYAYTPWQIYKRRKKEQRMNEILDQLDAIYGTTRFSDEYRKNNN